MSLLRSARTVSHLLRNKQSIRAFSTSNSLSGIVQSNNKDFDEPTPVRLHDVTPNPLPKSLAPTHPEDLENYWLTMPSLFERAELLNPHIYDDLLV